MATIYDLIETTDLTSNTTYSNTNGNLLGVVASLSSTDLDDGEFDVGDLLQIGGTTYGIDAIGEPDSNGTITLGDNTDLTFSPGSESNLSMVFLIVSNGPDVRYFMIPNDSFGDMNIQSIQTGNIGNVAGSDAAIISTTDDDINVVCFVAGTMIEGPRGETAVEDISIGDLVMTRYNGLQAVRAVITHQLDLKSAPERLKPVLFEQGALGPDRPNRPLCVSAQHRMLVTNSYGHDVLVPAKALTARRGVRVMHGRRDVTYFHLVFSRHEIIRANGTYAESFFPGPQAIKTLPPGKKAEVEAIFAENMARSTGVKAIAAAPFMPFQMAKRQAAHFV